MRFWWLVVIGCVGVMTAVPARAGEGSVRFNEIAWMGTDISANDEWIELYNAADLEVVLDGWRVQAADDSPAIALGGVLPAGGYLLLERTDDESVPDVAADALYTGALSNDGEALSLHDAGNIIVDSIDAASGWPGGDNTTKQTLVWHHGTWTTSAARGGTPRRENDAATSTAREEESASTTPDDLSQEHASDATTSSLPTEHTAATSTPPVVPPVASEPVYRWGDVVVNEFVADPADGEVEWIELFNTQSEAITLEDWEVTEGSGARTTIEGVLPGHGYIVLEKPKGNLNNSGDTITVRWKNVVVDRVVYGERGEDAAPVARDPYSVARKGDGVNTFHNANDFAITSAVTKGSANRIVDPFAHEHTDALIPVAYDYATEMYITEYLPNPLGSDAEGEFIELYNAGNRPVDMTGWSIGDATQRRYRVGEGSATSSPIIPAGAYRAFFRAQTGIALNNTGDTVRLWQPLQDEPLRSVAYRDAVEGMSYAQATSTGAWHWSARATPGEENVIARQQYPPDVAWNYHGELRVGQVVFFDASDTTDRNDDTLSFLWDLGGLASTTDQNPIYIFHEPGAYDIALSVSDGAQVAVQSKTIVIDPVTAATTTSLAAPDKLSGAQLATTTDYSLLAITELLPNPTGSDAEGEFIELYNGHVYSVQLNGWGIDDEDGGSKLYTLRDIQIEPFAYVALPRNQTGIALNNDGDVVRLLQPNGAVVAAQPYTDALEGYSYARVDGAWQWSAMPTPGKPNQATPQAILQTSFAPAGAQAEKPVFSAVALRDIPRYEAGVALSATGTVAVAPGVLGSQYFYIVGDGGVQVYSYKKDFPDVAVGDVVMVTGELSQARGEWRIKTAAAHDIQLLATSTLAEPLEVTSETVRALTQPQLVRLGGEVVDRRGSTVWLDDGMGEVEVYLKQSTGIHKTAFTEGETVAVTGVYIPTGETARLYPRSTTDIARVQGVQAREAELTISEAAAPMAEWQLQPAHNKEEFLLYGMLASLALNGGLGVAVWRRRA